MSREARKGRLRILVAKPGIDSHWIGAMYLATALRDAGIEAIYTGLFQSPEMIVTSALQEDVDAIALSMLAGQHLETGHEIMRLLKEKGCTYICVFAGGIIPERDRAKMEKMGITGNFGPGTPVRIIIDHITQRVGCIRDSRSSARPGRASRRNTDDRKAV